MELLQSLKFWIFNGMQRMIVEYGHERLVIYYKGERRQTLKI
jgi:hypothetical protein